MGYKPKEGITPINLLGRGCKHRAFTQEEKAKIIQKYLADKGVDSIEELPQSSQYDLMNRKLRGRMVQGSEYQFGYQAYDIQDVEPIEGVEVEKEPEEPDNWWWNKLPENEKDIEQVKCDLHEIADNNDIGAELSTKAHNWYYGKVLGKNVENEYDCI